MPPKWWFLAKIILTQRKTIAELKRTQSIYEHIYEDQKEVINLQKEVIDQCQEQ